MSLFSLGGFQHSASQQEMNMLQLLNAINQPQLTLPKNPSFLGSMSMGNELFDSALHQSLANQMTYPAPLLSNPLGLFPNNSHNLYMGSMIQNKLPLYQLSQGLPLEQQYTTSLLGNMGPLNPLARELESNALKNCNNLGDLLQNAKNLNLLKVSTGLSGADSMTLESDRTRNTNHLEMEDEADDNNNPFRNPSGFNKNKGSLRMLKFSSENNISQIQNIRPKFTMGGDKGTNSLRNSLDHLDLEVQRDRFNRPVQLFSNSFNTNNTSSQTLFQPSKSALIKPEPKSLSSLSRIENAKKGLFSFDRLRKDKIEEEMAVEDPDNNLSNLETDATLDIRKLSRGDLFSSPLLSMQQPGAENQDNQRVNIDTMNNLSMNDDSSDWGWIFQEKVLASKKRIGVYEKTERLEKILKYKKKIRKWRIQHPVNKRFKGRNIAACQKPRIKGRFVTSDKYSSYIDSNKIQEKNDQNTS